MHMLASLKISFLACEPSGKIVGGEMDAAGAITNIEAIAGAITITETIIIPGQIFSNIACS